MPIQSQESRLDGKRHAARASQAHGAGGGVDSERVCLNDQVRTIKSSARTAKQPSLAAIASPQNRTDRSLPPDNNKSPRTATYGIERVQVGTQQRKAKNKIGHIAVPADHRASLVQGPPTTPQINTCTIQNTAELPEYMAISSNSNTLLWKCTLCNLYMVPALGPAHLACKAHVERLLCSVMISGSVVLQEQNKKHLQGPKCEPQMLQSSNAMMCSPVFIFLVVQQSNDAELRKPVYNTETLGILNSPSVTFSDIVPNSKPTVRFWACQHCSTEVDIHQNHTHYCLASKPSVPSPADNPLDYFFSCFSKFPYDASVPPATSYQKLRAQLTRWYDWDGNQPETWKEYQEEVHARYQAALTREFNLWFGTEDDLKSWHALCRAVRITPLPPTCKGCRSIIHDQHVNIVDLIQWARQGETGAVQIFSTVEELSDYSYEQDKIYNRNQLGPGVVLRHLLRMLKKAHKKSLR